jgi:hypothetical protein
MNVASSAVMRKRRQKRPSLARIPPLTAASWALFL